MAAHARMAGTARSMPLHAVADHSAVEHVEGGEQGCRAVPPVVVGHCAAAAGLEGQSRLGTIQRLDLALFINRQYFGQKDRREKT
jgi:hypothetical protein